MTRPIVLDVCCGVGGATRGYQRAGFRVVGVDIEARPDYCGDDFYQDDAFAFLIAHGREFDRIHVSFPCQASAATTKANRTRDGWTDDHIDLNPAGRALLDALGVPYVMENVQGSVLRRDLTLCGLMWPETRRVFRHRYFELGLWTPPVAPEHPSHAGHRVSGWRHGVKYEGDMVAVYGDGGGKATAAEARDALGIDWTWDRDALVEAIPPAYTEFIGRAWLTAGLDADGVAS
jgi:hypothetical protein